MAMFRKLILAAALGSSALLTACAAGPYYDNTDYGYGYERGYDPRYYGYDYGYAPYVAPSVGLGFTYSDRDRRQWRDNDGRWRDRGDRREWRDSRDSRPDDGIRYDGGTPSNGSRNDPSKDHGQYSSG